MTLSANKSLELRGKFLQNSPSECILDHRLQN